MSEESAAPAPQPVMWQYRTRFRENTSTPGWSEWEELKPRNPHTDTMDDRVKEMLGYIAHGYGYEVRPLYTHPPSEPQAVQPPSQPTDPTEVAAQHAQAFMRGHDAGWAAAMAHAQAAPASQPVAPPASPDDEYFRGINEGLRMAAESAEVEEQMKKPPCVECGAMTLAEANEKCRCAGDKDDCHGCRLWPDPEDAAPARNGGETGEATSEASRDL